MTNRKLSIEFFGQFELREEYQAIFWYVFLVDKISPGLEMSVNDLIHSEEFTQYCFPFKVKKSWGERNQFLKRAFDLNKLDVSNFKMFNKEELLQFFDIYAASDTWKDDKEKFASLMYEFKEMFKNETANQFFLIGKEWFDKDSALLSEDSEFFIYYFILIWFDTE